jgi:hypothetical protein
MLLVFNDERIIRIEDPSRTFRCERDGSFAASFGHLSDPKCHIDFGLRTFEANTEDKLDRVLFHIVNLNGLHHRDTASESGGSSLGELVLRGGGWKLRLQPNHPQERVRISGPAFRVTYIGILEKENESPFRTNEAADVLEGLYYFLSFVRGAWCWPCAYIGLHSSEFRWLLCRQAKDIHALSDLDLHGLSFTASDIAVSGSFEGFLKLWNDSHWRTPIKTAISWAIDGRRSRSIESSLVGGQTALELISWIQLVERNQILSPEGCDKLPASDRLRLLLTFQTISTDLSSRTPDLTAYSASPDRKWDGPRVLTELRNSIIHPKRRDRFIDAPESVRQQARLLTESYLSFVLLRLFGYSGELPHIGH